MAVDPSELDRLLAAQGGFREAYKKLQLLSKATLAMYDGNSSARVALRQIDADEVVNHAFERLFSEGFEDQENVYFKLRNFVKNFVRTKAKLKKEARTIRVTPDSDIYGQYEGYYDPTEQLPDARMDIIDDFDFCKKVIFRLRTDISHDEILKTLCDAIIEGYTEPEDLMELMGVDKSGYRAAFLRLRRRYKKAIKNQKLKER